MHSTSLRAKNIHIFVIFQFFTDDSFTTAITRHAKLQSNYTDVYLCQFSYQGKMGGLKDFEVAGKFIITYIINNFTLTLFNFRLNTAKQRASAANHLH